jgi:hypothetical protein
MVRRRSPFRALFTVFAFVLATIAPDRASTRERGAPIVESHAASTTAIPALWNLLVHAVEHAGASRDTHVPRPWIASRVATLGESTPAIQLDRETLTLREPGHYAFTYDATAPPSMVEL